jgi:protein-S-isoprenylcysteine O-methyltransferase Ste14
MYLRALFAFIALPGMVAGLIPALLVSADDHRGGGTAFGFVFMVPGLLLLLTCVRDFFVSGRGTLAPWDPPKHLVVVGLYRFVRNPMYVCVLTLLAGWWLVSGSRWIAWYGAAWAVIFHLRVVYHEERWLQRQFGTEWAAYSASVRRWLPRLHPWQQDEASEQCASLKKG